MHTSVRRNIRHYNSAIVFMTLTRRSGCKAVTLDTISSSPASWQSISLTFHIHFFLLKRVLTFTIPNVVNCVSVFQILYHAANENFSARRCIVDGHKLEWAFGCRDSHVCNVAFVVGEEKFFFRYKALACFKLFSHMINSKPNALDGRNQYWGRLRALGECATRISASRLDK